ncbi:MAG: hypothetical protein LUC06_02245 [Oscillospiraceae bacterium]|nr:hypothetical protein [Oscillospiraceae bacterium]
MIAAPRSQFEMRCGDHHFAPRHTGRTSLLKPKSACGRAYFCCAISGQESPLDFIYPKNIDKTIKFGRISALQRCRAFSNFKTIKVRKQNCETELFEIIGRLQKQQAHKKIHRMAHRRKLYFGSCAACGSLGRSGFLKYPVREKMA